MNVVKSPKILWLCFINSLVVVVGFAIKMIYMYNNSFSEHQKFLIQLNEDENLDKIKMEIEATDENIGRKEYNDIDKQRHTVCLHNIPQNLTKQ